MGQTLLKNRFTTLLLVLLLSGGGLFLPALYIVVGILIAFITLGRNPQEGGIVAGWAILPLLAFGAIEAFAMPVVTVMVSCLMIWVLATILFRYSSWLLVLEVAVGFAMAVVLLVTSVYPEFVDTLAVTVASFLKETQALDKAQLTDAQLTSFTHLSMGFMMVDMLLETLLALMVARAWQAKLVNPGGFGREFQQLRLGKVMLILMAAAVIGAFLQFEFALQVVPILLIAFLVAGFSLAHSLINHQVDPENKPFALVFFYSACVFFLIFALPMIIFAAFLDSVYDFRQRFVVQ